ncbi:hypothetical protein M3Y98_01141400 [Aphelenchoides besseyi]|nr:hypothetical protein M3Y98_01141400 [Aphelenchoides besseyi]
MVSLLVSGLLIGSALVSFVDASAFTVDVQFVKRVHNNNTLKAFDIYGEGLNSVGAVQYKDYSSLMMATYRRYLSVSLRLLGLPNRKKKE